MKIIEGKRALTIARRHRPIIHQGFEHPVDMPCRINFGEFKFSAKPVIYYWVRTDEKYYYIGYALYHYADYTKCVPAKILGLGEHRHDFEGILLRVPYYLPHHRSTLAEDVITVYHDSLWYSRWSIESYDIVSVSSRGHPITPFSIGTGSGNYLTLHQFKYVHLTEDMIRKYKPLFNEHGVHMPDQWAHKGKYKGWFWDKPDKLFRKMSK